MYNMYILIYNMCIYIYIYIHMHYYIYTYTHIYIYIHLLYITYIIYKYLCDF